MADGKRKIDEEKRVPDGGKANPPAPTSPGSDDDYEDGDISTPKRDRDDEDQAP
jgi:hypothetical protein